MSSKSKSQEQELTVPEPVIEFEDVEGKTKEAILTASKAAYLLKLKDEYSSWRECAGHIKEALDKSPGPTWHIIAGSSFGSFVTHQAKNCLFLRVGEMKVLAFKHG